MDNKMLLNERDLKAWLGNGKTELQTSRVELFLKKHNIPYFSYNGGIKTTITAIDGKLLKGNAIEVTDF